MQSALVSPESVKYCPTNKSKLSSTIKPPEAATPRLSPTSTTQLPVSLVGSATPLVIFQFQIPAPSASTCPSQIRPLVVATAVTSIENQPIPAEREPFSQKGLYS